MTRHVDKWNRRKDPETDPDIDGQLFWTIVPWQLKGKAKFFNSA